MIFLGKNKKGFSKPDDDIYCDPDDLYISGSIIKITLWVKQLNKFLKMLFIKFQIKKSLHQNQSGF